MKLVDFGFFLICLAEIRFIFFFFPFQNPNIFFFSYSDKNHRKRNDQSKLISLKQSNKRIFKHNPVFHCIVWSQTIKPCRVICCGYSVARKKGRLFKMLKCFVSHLEKLPRFEFRYASFYATARRRIVKHICLPCISRNRLLYLTAERIK